jgi:hypothetical protein
LAKKKSFAKKLSAQARQAAAERAWAAITRFFDNSQQEKPRSLAYYARGGSRTPLILKAKSPGSWGRFVFASISAPNLIVTRQKRIVTNCQQI